MNIRMQPINDKGEVLWGAHAKEGGSRQPSKSLSDPSKEVVSTILCRFGLRKVTSDSPNLIKESVSQYAV